VLTPEQVAERGLGGTDIAAICGVNPYKSPLRVYLRVLGLGGEGEPPPSEAAEWGIRLEPVVAAKYHERYPTLNMWHPPALKHPTVSYVQGTPDRVLCDPLGQPLADNPLSTIDHGLEIKTAGWRQMKRWGTDGDDVPEEYLLQCAWYMLLCDCDRWNIAALFAGQTYREYGLERDAELEAMLLERAEAFWTNHILKGVPPEPDATEADAKALARIYPRERIEVITCDDEADQWLEELRVAREYVADWETKKLRCENLLKHRLGDAEGVEGTKVGVSWKATKPRSKTDWRAIALELGATDELIAQHTTEAPGPRVFHVHTTRRPSDG
jgi:putative phage-type endonuclease